MTRSTQPLLASMAALQVLWLVSIWLTGAAPNRQKLPLLLVYSVVCAVIIARLPAGIVSSIRRVKERLERDEKLLYAILGAVVLGVGGVYAHVQQGWPDETHVFAAARITAEQGVTQFFADYARIPWLGTQHPPLALLVYGGALRVFGVSLFVIRLASLLLGLATLLLTYRLGSTLYDRHTGLLAVGYLLATPFFFRVGATALTDMPVTFCFVLAVYVTLCLLRTPTYRLAVALGLCIGAGLLCRYTMVFIYLVLASYITVSGSFRQLAAHLALVVLISGGMLATWFAYAYHLGVLATQRDTITSYSAFVMTATSGRWWLLGSLLFRVPSGLGTYNLPLLLLGGWQLLRRRSPADRYVLLWITAVFLPLMLTLPGPRYFLPAFPALTIAMACGLERADEAAERAVLLALLYGGGALYLFVDWTQAAGGLFSH